MIRRPPRSTHCISSAASDVYKRQELGISKEATEINSSKNIEVDTGDKSDAEPGGVSAYPGPVFNEDIQLLEPFYDDPEDLEGFTKHPLKYGLTENIDFALVPGSLWELWREAYGGLDIPRRACAGEGAEKPMVEVYLQRVPLHIKPLLKGFPKDVIYLYLSKRKTAAAILEKVKAICARCLIKGGKKSTVEDNIKMRMWKVHEEDIEELDRLDWDIYKYKKEEIEVSGDLIEEERVIEDLAIGETTAVVAEIAPINVPFKFKKLSITHPRMESMVEGGDCWKDYVTLEENKFMKIPLKRLVNLKTMRCGWTGLENLGNTCYMNSGLQCLSNCQELTKYFLLGLYKRDINKANPLGQKGYFAETYAELLDEMWRGNSKSTDAYTLKRRIVVNAKQFQGYAQHDSQELIMAMLDGLHEDLNRIKKKPYIEVKDYENMSDAELSLKRWNEYLQRDKSIITDLFVGQLKSKLVCPLCNGMSIVFDPFMMLSVPIPQPSSLIVNFVPSNFKRLPERLRLNVNDATLIADINKILFSFFKLEGSDSIYYAVVVKGRIYKHLELGTTCSTALTKGELFAYQVPALDKQPECYFVEVDVKYISSGFMGETVNSAEFPLVLPVPLNSTVAEIKLQVLNRLLAGSRQFKDPLTQEQLKALYSRYFESKFDAVGAPYAISILNNRAKSSRFLLFSRYEDCEFCSNKGHSDNCPFQFANEDKAKLSDLLKSMKDKRRFILGLKLNPRSELLELKKIISFFRLGNEVKMIEASAGKSKVKITLYNCLEAFGKEECLDEENMWYCGKCKKHVAASKKMDLYKLPDILVIHLKRFRNKPLSIWSSAKKISDFVDYPISGLNVAKYTLAPEEISGGCLYDLFAVSNHFGGLSGGHYTATCFNSVADAWLYFDDTSVYKAVSDDLVTNSGYVLFYRRVKKQ
eukprot:TRINITY_DN2371_c0_g5_i4.p1 TRINITY_DN2371_c0_g5~~TRINITY_DN2371_c0_g5_i4.p1  ORF type:complete len:932 (-),score=291.53 TRINITY_DN2371_c0_g5_i4:108-2882(-)